MISYFAKQGSNYRLLGLDPSFTKPGVSLFVHGELQNAECLRRPSNTCVGPEGWHEVAELCFEWAPDLDGLAVEYPQIYSVGKSKGDPNDLFPVACVAQSVVSMVLGRGGDVETYLPSEWKGTREKDVNTVDVRKRLTPAEFKRIQMPTNTCEHCASHFPAARCIRYKPKPTQWEPCSVHNAYDAVGIALKALGRFERHRVIPR